MTSPLLAVWPRRGEGWSTAARRGTEAPLHSTSMRMELGGRGWGASDRVRRQLQSMGRLAAYLTRRIHPLRGRRRCLGDAGRRGWWRVAAAWDWGGSTSDWDGQTAARCREVVTHEHRMRETSFHEDLIFLDSGAREARLRPSRRLNDSIIYIL
jgi:hypothetical protein